MVLARNRHPKLRLARLSATLNGWQFFALPMIKSVVFCDGLDGLMTVQSASHFSYGP